MGYKRRKRLDGRTKEARRIAQIQELVKSDLNAAAVQILERDIAYLTAYGESLVKNDMTSKSLKSLPNFLKIHTALKGALAALNKLKPGKQPKGLADLFDDSEDGNDN